MFYDRQLRYLELWEAGEKIRTAGFVKIEVMGEHCNIQMQVTGLPVSEDGQYQVYLEKQESESDVAGGEFPGSREYVLDILRLQDGRGSLIKRRIPVAQLCKGMEYAQLYTIRIPMREERMLLCRWRDANVQTQPEMKAVQESGKHTPVETETKAVEAEVSVQESVQECQMAGEQVLKEQETTAGQPDAVSKTVPPAGLKEHKWQQLSEIYPHISPFRDERDYLSLTPADFVIFSQKDYCLASNSFLQHGYYNYGHLVLARKMRRGQEVYYLGVPGNFFEREREVAIMFGFESFEGKTEPASDGDYGYYMIRVEL